MKAITQKKTHFIKTNYYFKWTQIRILIAYFALFQRTRIIRKYSKFFIIRDAFPVTHLHTLVISNRHIESYFDLNPEEIDELKLNSN